MREVYPLTEAQRIVLLDAVCAGVTRVREIAAVFAEALESPAGRRLAALGRYAEQHPEWRP